MSCEKLTDELSAYFDNELPAVEREALTAHLRDCSTCQATLSASAAVRQRLELLPIDEPSADLVSRTARKRLAPSRPWRTFEALALTTAAGFVVSISTLLFNCMSKPGLPSIPPTARDHWGVEVTQSAPQRKLLNFECKGVLLA